MELAAIVNTYFYMELKLPPNHEIQELDLQSLLDLLVQYTGLYTRSIRENGFHHSEAYKHAIKDIQAAIEHKHKDTTL